MDLQKLSESVYVGLSRKLGTPQQVAIRREVNETNEFVKTKGNSRRGNEVYMLSGSRGEGFRFEDSDLDIMLWNNLGRVLWDFSQVQFYSIDIYGIMLSDSSESPPGFTLISLPFQNTTRSLQLCPHHCVNINGILHVSSEKHRDSTCFKTNVKTHGPCKSGRIGNAEYDHAHCLFSDFWPPMASSWVSRCHTWPSPNVGDDIIKSGCHLVAIGHKLGQHVNDEWRISFSMAEKKLVYSMNHTQFLTYGLLKMFLKEIINNRLDDEERVLCSYHIKTVVFWALQQNSMFDWCPTNLLEGFWVCFKLLLKWIYEGICPNFFIPENNMFLSNVYGEAQEMLYTRMQSLYEMGIVFLLQSPSIRPFIIKLLGNPRLSIVTQQTDLISEVELDFHLFEELWENGYFGRLQDLWICLEYLEVIEQMLWSTHSEIKILVLHNLLAQILQSSAFLLLNMHLQKLSSNKAKYSCDRMLRNMLNLAAKFGCPTDMLYIAMYYYRTSRYSEALSVVERTKEKMAIRHGRCRCRKHQMRYMEAFGGHSWAFKMKHIAWKDIRFFHKIIYLDEFILEQHSSFKNTGDNHKLAISPAILIHMLEFLCCRQTDSNGAYEAVEALEYIVRNDWGGIHVTEGSIKLSWQILGICQHMVGNHHAALHSYQQSLQQDSGPQIESATFIRIQDLHLS